jgi:LPPG:FO 2-phospho-L-lactate transferase
LALFCQLDGIRDALKKQAARIVGISPIVAGAPIKGPADKMLRGLGFEVSAFGVAKLYADFLDTFVIDNIDAAEKSRIENLGIQSENYEHNYEKFGIRFNWLKLF